MGVESVSAPTAAPVVAKKPTVKKTKVSPGVKRVSVAAAAAKAHPSWAGMLVNAVKALNEKGGSSMPAIKKYILANYRVDADKTSLYIRRGLKAAITSSSLVQVKGKGLSGSFKLGNSKAKPAKKPTTGGVKKTHGGVKKTHGARPTTSKTPKKSTSPKKAAKKPASPKKAKSPAKAKKPAASKPVSAPAAAPSVAAPKAAPARKAPAKRPAAPKKAAASKPKVTKKAASPKKQGVKSKTAKSPKAPKAPKPKTTKKVASKAK